MERWQYLGVLGACIAITLPLEAALGARVYRQPLRLAATLLPVIAIFGVWDLIAVHHGHWWWSAEQVTGARLLGLPVEEWVFFAVIPVCALLTYEVLGRRWPSARRRAPSPGPIGASTGGKRLTGGG